MAVFSGAHYQEKRQWAQNGIQEVPSEHQQALLVGDGALAQIAQTSCGVFSEIIESLCEA